MRALLCLSALLVAVGCKRTGSPSQASASASAVSPAQGVSTASPAPSASTAAASRSAAAEPWVRVPAGAFVFGCSGEGSIRCPAEEQPRRTLHTSAFEIQRTEVTQAAYQQCIDAGRCAFPTAGFDPKAKPRHAVVGVSWSEARGYCAFIGARLPSETEWEKAARGPDGRPFPWGTEAATCRRAHFTTCGAARPAVGSHPEGKSPYGVLDMAGGVDEWVADLYVSAGSTKATSGQRVARGGAHDEWHIRATARSALAPEFADEDLGFRCARDAAPP